MAKVTQNPASSRSLPAGRPPSPRINPGRDPAPDGPAKVTTEQAVGVNAPEDPEAAPGMIPDHAPAIGEPSPDRSASEAEAIGEPLAEDPQLSLILLQRQRRQLLKDCARLQVFDFQILSMPGWPENSDIVRAGRRRDQWVFVISVLAVIFLGGMLGLVPAWLAGPAFGGLLLAAAMAVPAVRQLISSRASYGDLMAERRRLLRAARKHIAYLEGDRGLAWQCQPLTEYSAAMRQARFQGLYNLSRTGNLARYIRSRGHVRLYLMFVLEAEKAYEVMQARYLEAQEALQVPDSMPVDSSANTAP